MSEGQRIVSVVGVGSCGFGSYYAPAIYEARRRKDGVLTFRRVGLPLGWFLFAGHTRLPVGRRSVAKAKREAQEYAEARGLPFEYGIRHGTKVPEEQP